MYTSASNIDALFVHTLTDCLATGDAISPRGMECKEINNYIAKLTDPRARLLKNDARRLREGYAAASVCWNLGERNDVDTICWWNPNGKMISDDGTTFYGANYGQR